MAVREDAAVAVSYRMPLILRHRIYTPLLAILGFAAVASVVWFADPTTPGGILPPCPIRYFLHIDCPGCGATRALYALLHGDLGVALQYNALAVVALAVVTVTFAWYVIGLWTGRRRGTGSRWRGTPLIGLVVLMAVWFVIRNIPMEPFVSLKV